MGVIVNIDHETGNLSQYSSSVTGGGDLSVSAGAALAGTNYGLSVLINDTGAIYGIYTLGAPDTAGKIRLRFYIDPTLLTMATNDIFDILRLDNSSPALVGRVRLGKTATNHIITATMYNDAGTEEFIASNIVLTDTPHYIEYQITRSSGANDGTGQCWIDGGSIGSQTGRDNDVRFANFNDLWFGAAAGLDAGTTGTLYLDELIVNNDGGTIGPVIPPTPAIQTVKLRMIVPPAHP